MIYPAFIIGLITLTASMVLAYRNKAWSERQARTIHCEVKVTPRRIHRK